MLGSCSGSVLGSGFWVRGSRFWVRVAGSAFVEVRGACKNCHPRTDSLGFSWHGVRHPVCHEVCVGVHRFTELRAWQACDVYKKAVYRLCSVEPLATGLEPSHPAREGRERCSGSCGGGFWAVQSCRLRAVPGVGQIVPDGIPEPPAGRRGQGLHHRGNPPRTRRPRRGCAARGYGTDGVPAVARSASQCPSSARTQNRLEARTSN